MQAYGKGGLKPHGKPKNIGVKSSFLKLAVHFDAARLSPRLWLTALWWRVLGKRVRSRAQFAPLLGASRWAYRLWLLDERLPVSFDDQSKSAIVAFVGDGRDRDSTISDAEREGIHVLSAWKDDLASIALPLSDGRSVWAMWLEAGDRLAPGTGAIYRLAAESTASRIIYADDDLLDAKGQRIRPHFKPEWNAELFRHHDYATGACIVRLDAGDTDSVQSQDGAKRLIAFIAASTGLEAPIRLPHVLHHRVKRPEPRLPGPTPIGEAAPSAKVSVIIPTRDRLDLLRTCIEGLIRTAYPNFEVIVVDNGSNDPATLDYLANLDPARFRVLRDDGPFNFSRLNNRATRLATGELLCLLNNDIEVLAPDWLEIMVRQALRSDVGAVGARLLYPDGRIQHAGVVMGICGGAAHAHRLLRPDAAGYFYRHALPQFVSAVTAACLVVRRERFEAVGGLDEENFAVAFNDVDLCMRLNRQGWQSLYEPRATLIHHESVSRGFDRDPVGAARLASELAALKMRWGTGDMEGQADPFHHPQLSRYSERFALRLNG